MNGSNGQFERHELIRAVLDGDAKLANDGVKYQQRSQLIFNEVRERLGLGYQYIPLPDGGANDNAENQQILATFRDIYRYNSPQLFGFGLAPYLDTFVRVKVPMMYGRVCPNLIDHTELSQLQKLRIQSDKNLFWDFMFFICDVFDARMGLSNLLQSQNSGMRAEAQDTVLSMDLTRQLDAFYTALVELCLRTANPVSITYNALLTMELALKNFLSRQDETEKSLREMKHNNQRLLKASNEKTRIFGDPVVEMVQSLPGLVDIRYGKSLVGADDAFSIALLAQFVVATTMRHLTDRNLLVDAMETSGLKTRAFDWHP